MEPSVEIIQGEQMRQVLSDLIDSRKICRMEVPRTGYGWFVLLLGIRREKGFDYLLIDRIGGFEKALADSQDAEILIEFLEKSGAHCHFKTRTVKTHPDGILAELPGSISRLQKRAYFRMGALLGAEVAFQSSANHETRGPVKDYSLGGVSFRTKESPSFPVGYQLTDICLTLPQGQEWICFRIPQAIVRRVEQDPHGENLYGLEFQEIDEKTKEQLWRHIFKVQRLSLQKTKKP
jgi:c-di-GMP-binding flagellar brake protein YcgR